ncbi:MAG: hypothetical protein R3242_08510 [Akkermansiaceae bacterium]|nr:hypothetical protein [Akkermansiaceae bacterium]
MEFVVSFSLVVGWSGFLGGVLSGALLVILIIISSICFLYAWKKSFRHFFVPVQSEATGISAILFVR